LENFENNNVNQQPELPETPAPQPEAYQDRPRQTVILNSQKEKRKWRAGRRGSSF